jgi:hypothetical protein
MDAASGPLEALCWEWKDRCNAIAFGRVPHSPLDLEDMSKKPPGFPQARLALAVRNGD